MRLPANVFVHSLVSSSFVVDPCDVACLMLASREWRVEFRAEQPAMLRLHLAFHGADGWLCYKDDQDPYHAEKVAMLSDIRIHAVIRAIKTMQACVMQVSTSSSVTLPPIDYKRHMACMTDGSLFQAPKRGDHGCVLNTIVVLSMLYAFAATLHESVQPSIVDIRPWAAYAMFHYVGIVFAGHDPLCNSVPIATLLLMQLDDVVQTQWGNKGNCRVHERLHWLLRRTRSKLARMVALV